MSWICKHGEPTNYCPACLRAELEVLRATITTQAELIAKLKADVATMEVTEYEAERFAPEYERQIKEPLEQRIKQLEDIVFQREASIREMLLIQRLPENEKDRRIANQADSLTHWAALWAHIEACLGDIMIPNERNFDAMLSAHVAELEAENAQAVIVLQFYAAPRNYRGMTSTIDTTPVDIDAGENARAWLAAHPAPEPVTP
jgi:hypothetical protein